MTMLQRMAWLSGSLVGAIALACGATDDGSSPVTPTDPASTDASTASAPDAASSDADQSDGGHGGDGSDGASNVDGNGSDAGDSGANDAGSDAADANVPWPVVFAGDFDVTTDGRVITAANAPIDVDGATLSAVTVRCLLPSGAGAGATVEVYHDALQPAGYSLERPLVARARTSGDSVLVVRSGPTNGRKYRLFFLDASCTKKPTTQTFFGEYEYRDVGIDDSGNVAFVANLNGTSSDFSVRGFDASGAPKFELPVTGFGGSKFGLHVAMNRAGGGGIVTCQGNSADAIIYRRFTAAGAWVESAFVEVPGTANHSSFYDSHEVGMNDQGAFAITWFDNGGAGSTQKVAFFANDGSFVKTATLGTSTVSDNLTAFNSRVPSLGTDFFLPRFATQYVDAVVRFAANGTVVGTAPTGANMRVIAVDGVGGHYALDEGPGYVIRGAF